MRFIVRLLGFLLTFVVLAGRVIYAAGQTYFGMKSSTDYLKLSGKTVGKVMNITAVGGTVVSTIIGKTAATSKLFGPKRNTNQAMLPIFTIPRRIGWTAWILQMLINASGGFYGFTNCVAGYFGTLVLSSTTGTKKKGWKIIFQGTATTVAVTSGVSYFAYDFQLIKKNSEMLASAVDKAIEERKINWDRSLSYTTGVAAAIIPTYVGQAYFWAKPSIVALPYAETLLGETGIDAIVALACITTFFTVIGWLPSVYTYFANHEPAPDEENANIPVTCLSSTLKIIAYASGAIDSLGGNGLGPFISMIFAMSQLFKQNPYGWIIGYAAVCGVFAALTNMLFSVVPGHKDAEQAAFKPAVEVVAADDIEAALPLATEEKRQYGSGDAPARMFAPENAANSLLFFHIPSATTAEAAPALNLQFDA